VFAAVVLHEHIAQDGKTMLHVAHRGRSRIELADDPDLPQHERAPYVEPPVVNQEIRGLEALTTGSGGVNAEVRKQAIFGRDSREHDGSVSLEPYPTHRLMRWKSENAWMPVHREANVNAGTDALQDMCDYVIVGCESIFLGGVENVERTAARI
jgi:hypothetical protein